MLQAFIVFLVLFGLIWIFERKRREELDVFSIGGAIAVPLISAVLIAIVGWFLGFYPWSVYAAVIVALVATYLVLWRLLGISAGRSAAYTGAVVVTYAVTGPLVDQVFSWLGVA